MILTLEFLYMHPVVLSWEKQIKIIREILENILKSF